ncbi:hypothetical protein [Tardiphaga sp.]|uniref:hypothetical protein n=1 Tax=Tardiphaga sp. TaxID=1926292 RepID=UPI00352B0CDB
MTENVTNELIYETLKQIQGKLVDHDQVYVRFEHELRAIKSHLAGLVQSDLNRDSDVAALLVRIERIERRLDLHN